MHGDSVFFLNTVAQPILARRADLKTSIQQGCKAA